MEAATAQSQFIQLGKKISDQRIEAGFSIEECARFIQLEPDTYQQYEEGNAYPSLIELEALAYLFNTLPENFWEQGQEQIRQAEDSVDINYVMISRIRRRTIGLNLRQARMEAGLSPDELAGQLGISAEDLNAYEMGVKEIPIHQLAVTAEFCGLSLDTFLDRKSPIGNWAENRRMDIRLESLPYDLKEFVSRPINQPYLELAKKLSEMPVQQLREIAEGILEITL